MVSTKTRGLARIALFSGIAISGSFLAGQIYGKFANPTKEVSQTYQETIIPEEIQLYEPQIERVPTKLTPEPFTGTNWILERNTFTNRSTIGNLYHDVNSNGVIDSQDHHLAHTLELPDRKNQRNTSNIPEETYEVSKRTSGKFGEHFKISDVQDRSDILIHAGNYPKDTQGCILVGASQGNNYVSNSRATLNNLLGEFENDEIRMKIVSTQN